MNRIHLKVDSSVYEHPEDRRTLKALQTLSAFEGAVKTFVDWNGVKTDYVLRKASNFHVTKESCPELDHLIEEAASILGVQDIPRVYTEWSYNINAYTWGYQDTTMMVLNTGVVDLMTDMEQTFVIGHELGHIKSKHVIYHTLAKILSSGVSNIPIVSSVKNLIFIPLMRWSRMSEFTSDRAGLLACQDVDAALRAIVKMSGVPHKYFDRININAILHEAESLQVDMSLTDKAFEKVLNTLFNDHPWLVLRAAELVRWVESGEYDRILSEYAAVKCPICGRYWTKGTLTCEACGSNLDL